MASKILQPTKPFSTSFTLERQFCTFSYRPSLLDSATVWHLAVMPFQVLRSTELLSTPITGYLQGLPLHCRHPASLRELFDRCSDHFLSIHIHTYIIIVLSSCPSRTSRSIWSGLHHSLSCSMNSNTCGEQYLAAD